MCFPFGPKKTGNSIFIFLLILQLCCVIWSSCVIKKIIFTWHSKVQSSSVIGREACFCNRKKNKAFKIQLREKLKCSASIFNVCPITIIGRSLLLARFWLFAWKIALKMLDSLHESVSLEFEDKNACGKPFVSSLKNMTW